MRLRNERCECCKKTQQTYKIYKIIKSASINRRCVDIKLEMIIKNSEAALTGRNDCVRIMLSKKYFLMEGVFGYEDK